MGISIDELEFFPVHEIKYEHWFQSIQPNGATLTQEQREEMVRRMDERVKMNSEGLRLLYDCCQNSMDEDSEYHLISQTINTILFFIFQTTSDCMVASKIYLLADQDYDKRYARGKLKVIMNEGFKKLYGFPNTDKTETYWKKLATIMRFFSGFDVDYQKIDSLLEQQSKQSTWWKYERNLEVHIDPVKLYESRQKELNEREVMLDTIKLLDALGIVEQFVWNLHTVLTNWLKGLYLNHPEQFKG